MIASEGSTTQYGVGDVLDVLDVLAVLDVLVGRVASLSPRAETDGRQASGIPLRPARLPLEQRLRSAMRQIDRPYVAEPQPLVVPVQLAVPLGTVDPDEPQPGRRGPLGGEGQQERTSFAPRAIWAGLMMALPCTNSSGK
jgi:hypothetical protein